MSYCFSIQILITRRNGVKENKKILEMTVIIQAYFPLSFIFFLLSLVTKIIKKSQPNKEDTRNKRCVE